MSIPSPSWPPPPERPAPENGPLPGSRPSLLTALGVVSLVGPCLLLPILWILALMAYGRGHTALFAVIGGLLALLTLGSGPAAWIMGNRMLAGGMAPPSQEARIRSGRHCGIVGTGFAALAVTMGTAFYAFARVHSP